MHVERYGNGPMAFLCLHGWSGDHRTFEPFANSVPDHATLWCPDLPGCGQSPKPVRWTLASVTDEVVRFAKKLPAPLHIIGNCSGALIGLMVAERVAVARIVMIDAFAYWPVYFRIFLAKGWGRYAYLTAFANPAGRWLANRSLANHRSATTDLTRGFSQVDHEVTYRYLEMLSEIRSPERFGRTVAARVEIAYGERSISAVRESAARWKRIFPAAREHELDGAGHLPIIEAAAGLES